MSIYFSRFGLNTYCGTPYFQAQLPSEYPYSLVLQKCRAFRRLPPNIRELASLAKRWWVRQGSSTDESDTFYDAAGYELDPDTGRRLTDTEIDAQWQSDPSLDGFAVVDIPKPAGGFPDPETWEPLAKDEDDYDVDVPTRERLMKDIMSHGAERVSRTYGIPVEDLPDVPQRRELDRRVREQARTAFPLRAARVLASAYLRGRPEDREFMTDVLVNSDTYDDLGGRALALFDTAELTTAADSQER